MRENIQNSLIYERLKEKYQRPKIKLILFY